MCREKTPWEEAVDFHGHSCVGLVKGYRVAEAALEALGNIRAADEELVAIVENDSCAVDAIQMITGCTLGKGNLIFQDHGKQVYTFALREGGKAVRITAKSLAEKESQVIKDLRSKVAAGKASSEEKDQLQAKTAALIETYLSKPLPEVCKVEEISINPPEKARLFAAVTCHYCGEKVMEPRARVKEGQLACIPCADNYSRGWGK